MGTTYTNENAFILPNIIDDPPVAIEEYPDYKIDRFGNVYRITGKDHHMVVLTPYRNNNYLAVKLNGEVYSVARLVAIAYIPNDDPMRTRVFHIDGDYYNNKADNLVWVEPREVKHLWAMEEDARRKYLENRDKD